MTDETKANEAALAELLQRLAALDPNTPEFGKDLGEYAMRGDTEWTTALYMLTVIERVREADQRRFYQFYCDVRDAVKRHETAPK